MKKSLPQGITTVRLPKLAAMIVFFLGLSTHTNLDAAPAQSFQLGLASPRNLPQDKYAFDLSAAADSQIKVLSVRDAALYRLAFAAQEQSDWTASDQVLAQIKDKKLVGHVLADRYLRRDMTLAEAQEWMASYAGLPEADDIYDGARHLRGFAAAHITAPANGTSWSGSNGMGVLSGFRAPKDSDEDAGHKNHIDSKINAALHHGDPIKARELLTAEIQRGTLSVPAAGDIMSRIAANFFYQGEIERARSMAHMAAGGGSPLGLWIDGLAAWKQQDFETSTRSFASLAQAPGLSSWDRAAASYWAYRGAKKIGDEAQARHWLAEAAKSPRSFYGYMAASMSEHAPVRSWKMPELTAQSVGVLAQREEGWQALALVQVGRADLAESELRRMNLTASHGLQTAALALAEKARMPSLTMQLGGVATNDNGQLYEAALYPLPPWQPAGGFKVDRALIYALMRHESQFDPEAVSGRGACGLMQIMPSTARQISNDNKAARDCSDHLRDPATNMDMGQQYVRVLAGQPMIGDNLLLLLAAYNGGPGNVARWLDADGKDDPLLFMETLPVRETRDYVQQVLLQYWMYRARLSEPETSVAQLARGQWPRYVLRDDGVQHAANGNRIEVASMDDSWMAAAK